MRNIIYKQGDKIVVNRSKTIMRYGFHKELGICLVIAREYGGRIGIKSTLAKREGYIDTELILGHINVLFRDKSI